VAAVKVQVVAQSPEGGLFLVNTGQVVPGKDETVRDLREGRVYDREAGTLLPPGSGPLPVGRLYWNGEWDDLTLAPDEVAAMEAHAAALMAAEREAS